MGGKLAIGRCGEPASDALIQVPVVGGDASLSNGGVVSEYEAMPVETLGAVVYTVGCAGFRINPYELGDGIVAGIGSNSYQAHSIAAEGCVLAACIVLCTGAAVAQGPAVTEDRTCRETACICKDKIGSNTSAVGAAAEVGNRAWFNGNRLRCCVTTAEAVAGDHAHRVSTGIRITPLDAAACIRAAIAECPIADYVRRSCSLGEGEAVVAQTLAAVVDAECSRRFGMNRECGCCGVSAIAGRN